MYRLIFPLLFAIITTTGFGQNKPVPAYVVNQQFPDSVRALSLLALDGTTTTLGDVLDGFRGKRVMIDIWASWCRDCIVALPQLSELHERADSDDVVILALSLDREEEKWRTAIDRLNVKGIHYWIPVGWRNAFSNYIVLDWIPRYLVLDENGRVVMPKAIHADDIGLVERVIGAELNNNE